MGIGIYTVLDNVTKDYAKAKEKHNKMHELYRSQKFSDAIELCEELKSEFDSKMTLYYNMWIERCEFQATQTLPKDWDGIFHASTK